MHNGADVIYLYDGSFDGFLCCVYHFYYNRLKPINIMSHENWTPSLFQNIEILTDLQQAARVEKAIKTKISIKNFEFLQDCFLTCLENKEIFMLRYIAKGFKIGGGIKNMLTDETVHTLTKARRHLAREQHLYLGIVRFYKAGEVYISSIKPKNQILPLIAWHFTQRFANQSFLIYDETHKQALLYSNNQYEILHLAQIELPSIDQDELATQKLWKQFYDTIAIKERYNPKCRMNFLPKRTWDRLIELSDET